MTGNDGRARAAVDCATTEEGHHWVWSGGPHLPTSVAWVGTCTFCHQHRVEFRPIFERVARRLRRVRQANR